MVQKYDKSYLERTVTIKLRKYFDTPDNEDFNVNAEINKNLQFTVTSGMNDALLFDPPPVEESGSLTPLIIIVFCVMGIMFTLSIMAWLHNQDQLCFTFPGSSPVDNAAWMACAVYSVQLWDFLSDINLSIEIFNTADLTNPMIFIAGLGSLVFIVIPYVANLIVAGRIKNLIKDNDAAKAWFTNYSSLFVLLVCFSGGCHPSLALVSSHIFGLRILNAGLTICELRQLTRIKVIGTILLENVPQLFFQLLYVYGSGIF